MSQPATFSDFMSVERLAPDHFITKWPTRANSFNPKDKVAYGGCTLAFAVKIGYATVAPTHRLYSVLGHFLSPALNGFKLEAKVTVIRDTRSFATRKVEILQRQGETTKSVASMQLDFHVLEKDSLLEYSAKPTLTHSPPDKSWDRPRMRKHAEERGVPEKVLKVLDGAIPTAKMFMQIRSPPESFSAVTFQGMLPKLASVQLDRGLTEKANIHHLKMWHPLKSVADKAAAMAFILDGGMPITPMSFAGLQWNNVGAVSSLDFAMRIFSDDVDVNDWVTREEKIVAGGIGRTYNEARVWDASGRMVASMSEQCLLRPKSTSNVKL